MLGSYVLPGDSILCSAKLNHLDTLLPQLAAKGSRVLLFRCGQRGHVPWCVGFRV